MATKKQERTRKLLEDFGKRVVKMSKRNLTDRKKVTGGKLHKSLGFKLKFEKGEPVFDWVGTKYATFVDKGVSGTKRKYNTPYSYTVHQPPSSALDGWVVRKNLAPRDSSGRFTGRSVSSVGFRKSITFLIARKIKSYGIKPTNFFQDAFNSVYKNMPEKFTEAFGEDMLNIMETAFKTD
jgi:hypothetical protein